jgi:hypothetical protein
MQRLGCQGIWQKRLHQTYPDAEEKNVLLHCLGLAIRLRHASCMVKVKWFSFGLFDKLFDIPDVRNVMINPRFC